MSTLSNMLPGGDDKDPLPYWAVLLLGVILIVVVLDFYSGMRGR